MKKSIVALAIAAAAVSGAANAKVDLYSDNGLAVQVSGEVDAFVKTGRTKVDGQDAVNYDPNASVWAMAQFDATYTINSANTVFASFEVEADGGGTEVKTDDVVVGWTNASAGTFSIGETGDSLDAIEKTDISNEGAYVASMTNYDESKGKGVRWQKDINGFVLSADVQTHSASESNLYGVSVDWAVNDMFTVAAAYADEGDDRNVAGISASVEVDNFYFAATVGQYQGIETVKAGGEDGEDYVLNGNTEGMTYGVAASYQMDATRFYATYEVADADEYVAGGDADISLAAYNLGVDHQVADNVLVFAEYNGADFDKGQEEARGDRVIVGAYLTF